MDGVQVVTSARTITQTMESQLNDSAGQQKNRNTSWERIGKYAIRKSPYQISKAFIDGCTMYVVWQDGNPDPIAYKENLDSAKAVCIEGK